MTSLCARTLTAALSGRRVGSGWIALCPAHDDRNPSLSVAVAHDGRVLVYCHAGCSQEAVIEALRLRGLWADHRTDNSVTLSRSQCAGGGRLDREDARRSKAAQDIWQASVSVSGTLVESYLGSRGLHLPPPDSIRFHGGLKHPSGSVWPAMVALVTRGIDDVPIAIHRTFLACNGIGKAPIEPAKMMLGPCRGGAVRLAEAGDDLMVGEGIETCLAAIQATARPAWAALSTAGLRALDLPDGIRDVTVLADGDEPGEKAAQDTATRWHRDGRRTRIARPPWGFDFNDVLQGRVAHYTDLI